jgi:hypothetical protein
MMVNLLDDSNFHRQTAVINISLTEVKNIAQLQAKGRFALILWYELCLLPEVKTQRTSFLCGNRNGHH